MLEEIKQIHKEQEKEQERQEKEHARMQKQYNPNTMMSGMKNSMPSVSMPKVNIPKF